MNLERVLPGRVVSRNSSDCFAGYFESWKLFVLIYTLHSRYVSLFLLITKYRSVGILEFTGCHK